MVAYSLAFDFNPILEIIEGISYEAANLVIRNKLNDNSVPGTHLYLGMVCVFLKSSHKREIQMCYWAPVWVFHMMRLVIKHKLDRFG